MYSTKQLFAMTLITAIIFTGLGCYLAKNFDFYPKAEPTSSKAKAPGQDTFQAGWEAAKKRLIEIGMAPMMMEGEEIKTAKGTVESADGNSISIKIQPMEPLADPKLDKRTVTIDSGTKINLRKMKDYKIYEAETAKYDKKWKEMEEKMMKQQTAADPVAEGAGDMKIIESTMAEEWSEPPEMYFYQTGQLSDIKVGMQISATADKDIKEAQEFKAVEITVEVMPEEAIAPEAIIQDSAAQEPAGEEAPMIE